MPGLGAAALMSGERAFVPAIYASALIAKSQS